ncbi:MAG: hypothetical protein KA807_17470 [Prolixibacteraceae bacterium]|nr:hypothetical protein [Prolixibacteraceae bacterium]
MQNIQIKYPAKKISTQFADFTGPMLEVLSDPKKPDEVEKVFKIGYMVWNAVVLSDARGDRSLLDQLQRLTSHVVETELITKNLIDRKRKYFGNDERLIGDYKISIKNGMLHIKAEARSPYSPHISTS